MHWELHLNLRCTGTADRCLDRLAEAIGSAAQVRLTEIPGEPGSRGTGFSVRAYPVYPLTRVDGELREQPDGLTCRATIAPVKPIGAILELLYRPLAIFLTIFFLTISLAAVRIDLFRSAEFGHWGIFIYVMPLLYLASWVLWMQNRRLKQKLERALAATSPAEP